MKKKMKRKIILFFLFLHLEKLSLMHDGFQFPELKRGTKMIVGSFMQTISEYTKQKKAEAR